MTTPSPSIARLQKVPLRELWRHEAHDFTTWLAENLDLLSEALKIDISLIEREASAGPFAADILAEDAQGRVVVIENQLERTDHSHLGQLITYLSNLEAKTAVWISSDPRPEHERAVHWLNETSPADVAFYLIKIEAYRIDDSKPAPLFTIVAGPTTEAKQAGAQKTELAERHVLRREFWKQLLEKAKGRTSLHSGKSPSTDNWLGTSAGRRGFQLNYVIRMDDAHVELYIDAGDGEQNKRLFETLLARKAHIEDDFGHPLDWQRLDDRRGCRIRYLIPDSGLKDQNRWPQLQDKLIEAMIKLSQTFQPEIKQLKETNS